MKVLFILERGILYEDENTALALMKYHKCFFNAKRHNILIFKNGTGNERIGRKDEENEKKYFQRNGKTKQAENVVKLYVKI